MAPDLAGCGVLVTRPAHQAEQLCRLVEQAGGRPIRFPLLAITGPADPAAVESRLRRLGDYRLLIFVSPNAVQRGMDLIERAGGLPAPLLLATVGKASAAALKIRSGRGPDLVPADGFDSEALLALPALQAVAGWRVLIVRGSGGRELLAETLRGRGAAVDYVEVYRRERAATGPALLGTDPAATVHVAAITSGEALDHLDALIGDRLRPWLHRLPLVVVSERIAEAAHTLGFTGPIRISREPGDEAIVAAAAELVGQTQRERS